MDESAGVFQSALSDPVPPTHASVQAYGGLRRIDQTQHRVLSPEMSNARGGKSPGRGDGHGFRTFLAAPQLWGVRLVACYLYTPPEPQRRAVESSFYKVR